MKTQRFTSAVAVFGFAIASTASFAQSNVIIYGNVDIGYEHASGIGIKASGINSGVRDQSRIGFRGEEDLGSGMKALFLLEYGLGADVNSGIGTVGSRQSYVGLSGDFGTLSAGRLYSPGKNFTDKYDAMDTSNFSGLQTLLAGTSASIATGTTFNNSMAYVSPSVNGFSFSGLYSFAGLSGDNTAYGVLPKKQERALGFNLDYAMGPLALTYSHHRLDDIAHVANDDQRDNALGASYDMGYLAVMGTYQTLKLESAGILAIKVAVYSLGFTVPISEAGLVRIQYASLNDKLPGDGDASSWSIGYDYSLSKRTMAYLGYNRVSNKNGVGISTGVGGGVFGGAPGSSSNSGYGFGVKHVF